MVDERLRQVAMLRSIVKTGTASIEVIESVITKAESGDDLSTPQIDLIMKVSGFIQLTWPTVERPPKKMTNIVDLARWWLTFLKKELEVQKRMLERLELELTEKDRQMLELGIFLSEYNGSYEPW